MTIQDAYVKYQIPPKLQMHQYRVAGVALGIAESISVAKVDTENIVRACLLHDMGNIIKFNMSLFPEFFEPEGIDFWRKVKRSFIKKYGPDEHVATMEIAREIFSTELGMRNEELEMGNQNKDSSREDSSSKSLISHSSFLIDQDRILDLIDAIGFSNAKRNFESDDFGWKIAAYADMRVEPYGVTSLQKRLEDGHKRFNLNKPGVSREEFFWEMAGYLEKIEDQIFEKSQLHPSDISEMMIQTKIKNLTNTTL